MILGSNIKEFSNLDMFSCLHIHAQKQTQQIQMAWSGIYENGNSKYKFHI